MKEILILLFLSFIIYFLNIWVEIGWYFVFLEGMIFTIELEWLPWNLIAQLPPVIVLYFAIGWLLPNFNSYSKFLYILIFASIVLMWKLIFFNIIWYVEPSLAYVVWHYILELIPSVSVLLGFQSRLFIFNRQNS